jgi:hypothetical protein
MNIYFALNMDSSGRTHPYDPQNYKRSDPLLVLPVYTPREEKEEFFPIYCYEKKEKK